MSTIMLHFCFACQTEILIETFKQGDNVFSYVCEQYIYPNFRSKRNSTIFEEQSSMMYEDEFCVEDKDIIDINKEIINELLEKYEVDNTFLCIENPYNICSICLESLSEKGKVCKLPCHHIFHYK